MESHVGSTGLHIGPPPPCPSAEYGYQHITERVTIRGRVRLLHSRTSSITVEMIFLICGPGIALDSGLPNPASIRCVNRSVFPLSHDLTVFPNPTQAAAGFQDATQTTAPVNWSQSPQACVPQPAMSTM